MESALDRKTIFKLSAVFTFIISAAFTRPDRGRGGQAAATWLLMPYLKFADDAVK